MKVLKALLLVVIYLTVFGLATNAQTPTEDVIYLKSNEVYRGIITEQVFNESYVIETNDGKVITIKAAEISRITKEPKLATALQPIKDNDAGAGKKKKERKPFTYRNKGYFFQGQALAELFHGGFHAVNGYKFGQFGYLGFGTGIDLIMSVPVLDNNFDGSMGYHDRYNGLYIPFYVYYSGDVLKKKITPFYAIEAGYVFSPLNVGGYSIDYNPYAAYRYHGGFTGSAGFGVKFNTSGRFNFNILAVVDFKTMHYNMYDVVGSPENPQAFTNKRAGVDALVFPGLRFGFAF